MGMIQTVLGPIEAEDVGPISMHEHLYRVRGRLIDQDADFRLDDTDKSARELWDFHDAGGRCIVEAEPLGGRDIQAVVEIAQRVPVHVVGTTGFKDSASYFNDFWGRFYALDEIVPLLVAEVEEGMEINGYCGPALKRSTAKAGAVKCGTSYHGIHPVEGKWIRAAARAHLATGVPIISHTERGTMALELIEILASEGVYPKHVVVGHIDRNPDLAYHLEIAKTGAFLQYDGPGRPKYYPDSTIIDLILGMVEEGYGKQIVLAGDTSRASYFRSYGGGPGFCYILRSFVPRLRSASLSEAVVQDLLINNPRRALSFAAPSDVTP